MTILDAVFEFSDAQNLCASGNVASGNSVVSTDVIDLSADEKDAFGTTIKAFLGNTAKKLSLVVTVSTLFAGAGAAVNVNIVSKQASASISSGGTTHGTVQIPAVSAAKTQVSMPLPAASYNRYVGLLYTVAGGTLTAGAVNAYLADNAEKHD